MRMEAYQYSNIGGRSENEDAVAYRTYGSNLVAVLADGLGGQGDGSIASRLICDSLIRCGSDKRFPSPIVVEEAYDKANRELLAKQQNAFHMKTTAVYLCLDQTHAIWAHVGDSRLYHLHNDKICDFTLDHSASQVSVFLGQIKREDIPGDSGRNRLLRALGVKDEKPDIHDPIELGKGKHVFLLCSDGLWEYLRDEDIEAAAKTADTPQTFLETLICLKDSRSAQNCDNHSAVAVFAEV